ncbi:hypothetical protein ACVWXN_003481 [Bradyrhizobium sp. i1.4.4]
MSWPGAHDATFTNSYRVARSSVSRVIDLLHTDAAGDYLDIPQVADGATVDANTGWAQVTTDLIIRRSDDLAPTNLNTLVLLKTIPMVVTDATSKDLYIKNATLFGGAAGSVANTAQATLNLMLEDVVTGYAGDSATNVNGYKFDFNTGLVAAVRCRGARAEADIFNGHWTPGGTPGLYLYTEDCIGRNGGRDTVQSCNGLTIHDDIKAADIGGEFYGNFGSNVIPINGCKMWCLGTYAHDSQGDVGHGGTSPPRDFESQGTAQLYLQNTRSAGSATSLIASNTSTIFKRNHTSGVGQTEGSGGGTITNF